jgi:hypothetical protein
MTRVVLRIWLPDRPGALGAVASRIGAVRGDLVGIEILERGAGRAIDELVIELPEADLLPLMVQEVAQVDGVDVEDARVGSGPAADPLDAAVGLVEQDDADALLALLTTQSAQALEAEWVAVVSAEGDVRASTGPAPEGRWLHAFVAGAVSSESVLGGQHGPDDMAFAPLTGAGLTVVVGRHGAPFRARERKQLAALARIAGRRVTELS